MKTLLDLAVPAVTFLLLLAVGSNTSLVHDPERGPLVRQAFEDLATGQYSKQEVSARATEAGLRAARVEGRALSEPGV